MKRDTWFIYFVLVAAGIISILVFVDPSPLVRGPGQWRWGLRPWPEIKLVLFSVSTFVLFLVGWYLIGRKLPSEPSRRRTWFSLTMLVILALLIQVSLLLFYRSDPGAILFERLASNRAAGYLSAAQEIENLPTFLQYYPELLPTLTSSFHAQTKPPGILLIYWSVGRIMERMPLLSGPIGSWSRNIICSEQWLASLSDSALASNAVVGFLTPMISAMAIFPAYGVANRRWGTLAGWIAAGLVALIPARLVFAPQMDTAYVFFSLLALFLADTGLRRRQPLWTFSAGLLLSFVSFMSPINLVVVVFIVLYILLISILERQVSINQKRLISHLTALVAGVVTVWVVYWILFGISVMDIYRAIGLKEMLTGHSYWFWLIGNIVEFVMFFGLPALFLASSWPFLKRHSKLPQAVVALFISYWIVIFIFDISGIIRGEAGRLWLMMAPFPALLAAIWLVYVTHEPGISEPVHRKRILTSGSVILIGSAAISLAIGLRWHVTITEWSDPIERDTLIQAPPVDYQLDRTVNDNLRLVGYSVAIDHELDLELVWQAKNQPVIPYTIFIKLFNQSADKDVIHYMMLQDEVTTATCWEPGEYAVDRHSIDLGDIQAGEYLPEVGLYNQTIDDPVGEPIQLHSLYLGE